MSIEREENNGIKESELENGTKLGIKIICNDDCENCKSLSSLTGRCAYFVELIDRANTHPNVEISYIQEPPSDSPYDDILRKMEELRESRQYPPVILKDGTISYESPDYIIRLCEAIVAEQAGYKDRNDWKHLQRIG